MTPPTHITAGRVKPALEAWTQAIREQREAIEALCTELDTTAQQLVEHVRAGRAQEASQAAARACDLEYELTGDCAATGALCAAIGVEIPEG